VNIRKSIKIRQDSDAAVAFYQKNPMIL